MSDCRRSPDLHHVWRTQWTCGFDHAHDSRRGCRYFYTCMYCGEPGYPIPADMLEDEDEDIELQVEDV